MACSDTVPGEGPRGLGGWLILPAIGLIVTPLAMLFTLINDYLPIFRQGYWQVLTTPGTGAYHPLWAPLLIFEVAGNLVFLAFDAVLLYLFFTKSHRLPRLFITYLVTRLIFAVTDFLLAGLIPSVADQLDPRDIAQNLVAAAIWIPYFLRSKRVKNTFVKGPPSTLLQPSTDSLNAAKRHLELAYHHEAQDRFEFALRECELAIQFAPDCAEAHNLRGIIRESLGRREEAIDAYREAVRLDPLLLEARQNLEEAEAAFGKGASIYEQPRGLSESHASSRLQHLQAALAPEVLSKVLPLRARLAELVITPPLKAQEQLEETNVSRRRVWGDQATQVPITQGSADVIFCALLECLVTDYYEYGVASLSIEEVPAPASDEEAQRLERARQQMQQMRPDLDPGMRDYYEKRMMKHMRKKESEGTQKAPSPVREISVRLYSQHTFSPHRILRVSENSYYFMPCTARDELSQHR